MLTTTIDATNRHLYGKQIEAARRLRHAVFVEEMGWNDLAKPDGIEIDQFDTETAVELVVEDADEVVGYQRFLPTTQPYLLSHVYPQLCDETPPSAPDLYEWTRYAVARSHRGDGRSMGPVALELVATAVEWGLANNVRAMIVEMSPVQLLRFVSCHFRVYPLGLVQQVGNQEAMAIRAEYDERTLDRLRMLRTAAGSQSYRAKTVS